LWPSHLSGEEERCKQVLAVIKAARNDPAMRQAMIDEAEKAEKKLIASDTLLRDTDPRWPRRQVDG
jgi:hypothetical protein